ncbi:hypothetical protein ACJMK2_020486, partial [Sinanodonta woodiana]
QPPHENANFSTSNFFNDISGYGLCPQHYCEEMLRNGYCNNIVHYVYQNQNCRCNCNGLRNELIQNELPLRIIVEGLRNGIAGGGLPRDVMVDGINANISNGIFGNRLSGNPNGMNANVGTKSGLIKHRFPLEGSGETSIATAAGGKEFLFNGGTGVNVGTEIDNGLSRRSLPLHGNSVDTWVGIMNGLVNRGQSPIGLGGDFSTGIGHGIIERRIPARSFGEIGTGMVDRRRVVRNDRAERIVDAGIEIGIESGITQIGIRRNVMVPGIRADIGSRLFGSNLPGNSFGLDIERGIMNGMIGLGHPLDDTRGAGVASGAGGIEPPLNGGVGVAVGSGVGSGIIKNELPSKGVIGGNSGSGISTGVGDGGFPLNGNGMDFRVGTSEALFGRGFSSSSLWGNFTPGIGPGIAGRGINAVGNRDIETLIGSTEPGSGLSWSGIRGDVRDGLSIGVGGSGIPVNTMGGNVGTGIGHGTHGSEWSPNGITADIGHGHDRSIFVGLIPGRAEYEYGPRRMFAPIGNPTAFHTGNMFLGNKATYWKKPYSANYVRLYHPAHYYRHNLLLRFF